MIRASIGWLVVPVALLAIAPAQAQIPDEFTNLQLLDKEITKPELMGVMRGFAGALGVRCAHCHVGPDNLVGMDFATDEKATKQNARAMMKMVDAINGTHLASIETGREAAVEVQCTTCHRGVSLPKPIGDLVAESLESDGIDAAAARYRELRGEYHGSASYDFSARPLNSLAERIGRAGELDSALAVLELNAEFHPEDSFTHTMIAQVHRERGDQAAAIASLEKAVSLDPKNTWAKRQLDALKAAGND